MQLQLQPVAESIHKEAQQFRAHFKELSRFCQRLRVPPALRAATYREPAEAPCASAVTLQTLLFRFSEHGFHNALIDVFFFVIGALNLSSVFTL